MWCSVLELGTEKDINRNTEQRLNTVWEVVNGNA